MISKGTIKYVKSLQLKKYRKKAQSFLVEGAKSVLELLNSPYKITHLLLAHNFLDQHPYITDRYTGQWWMVDEGQLSRMSNLKSNSTALAVAEMQPDHPFDLQSGSFYLALESIRDPGNLGTIIRTADWYGMDGILCSQDCADFYHPKVIQASMGSFLRLRPYYTDLVDKLKDHKLVYGAGLKGENIHGLTFERGGVFLVGNESQGLSPKIRSVVRQQLRIPGYGNAESLNVSAATAVICDNIRRGLSPG